MFATHKAYNLKFGHISQLFKLKQKVLILILWVRDIFLFVPLQAPSSRLLLVGWWLFGIAIVAAYAANLASIWHLIDGACVQVPFLARRLCPGLKPTTSWLWFPCLNHDHFCSTVFSGIYCFYLLDPWAVYNTSVKVARWLFPAKQQK